MSETLNYSAELADAISPVLERIATALESLVEQMAVTGESIVTAMEESTVATEELAGAVDSLDAQINNLVGELLDTEGALSENTAALEENTAALEGNAEAAGGAAAAHKDADASVQSGAKNLLGLSAIVAAVSGALIYMGAKSEDTFNLIQVFTGASQQQMQQYQATIDQMALKFGKTTGDLASGLYDIVSVGYKGADALAILNASAMAASAGEVDLHTVTNGLTAIMQAYSLNAQQANDVTDLMMMAVRDGKSDFGDFANAFSLVATTAHGAGFSLNESAAALSTLTLVFPDARQAGQDLNFLLRDIGLNVGHVAETAHKLGLNFDETKFSSMNLQERLQYLMQITHGNQDALLKLTGGAAGYAAFQVLMSNNGQTLNGILGDMANKTGLTAQAFTTHSDTMSMHAGRLMGAISVLADHLQALAAPVVNAALDGLSKAFGGFATLLEQHSDILGPILAGLAIIIGGVVVGALYSLAAAAGAAVAAALPIVAPIALIVAGAIGLGIALKNAYDHSKPFRDALAELKKVFEDGWHAIQPWVSGALDTLKQDFEHLKQFAGELADKLGFLANNALSHTHEWLENLKQAAENLWNSTKPLRDALDAFGSTLTGVVLPALKPVWQSLQDLWNLISSQVKPIWDQLVNTYNNSVKPAFQHLMSAIEPLLPYLKFLGMVIGGIVVVALGLLIGILRGAIQFIASFLQGIIQAVGGIIQFFSGLVQIIIGIFSGFFNVLKDLFTGNWQNIHNDLTQAWEKIKQGVKDALQGLIDTIMGLWHSLSKSVEDFFKGFIDGVVGFFKHLWDKLTGHSVVVDMINDVTGWFGKLPGMAMNALTNLIPNILGSLGNLKDQALAKAGEIVSSISDKFGSLASQAIDWGKNMIQGFGNGIGKMKDWLLDKAKGILDGIKNFFGFGSPTKEGPGSDADKWAPNLMKMYGETMLATLPAVEEATKRVADTVHDGLTKGTARAFVGLATDTLFPASATLATTGGSTRELHIHIHAEGGMQDGLALLNGAQREKFARQIADALTRRSSLQTIGSYGYAGN
jgi:TP901 family phage tail tape measure protein